jgi:purine nucleosidase
MRLHLDTDFAGDPDDACALALLLGWPGAEVTGITTELDSRGLRAGCVAYCLSLAGRNGIPVAAGAGASLTSGKRYDSTAEDPRYWPQPVTPIRSPPGAALDLLHASVERGATIVATGPLTNLAMLEVSRPGTLSEVLAVFMGGWIIPPDPGLPQPQWGPDMDWNTQCDTSAVLTVARTARLTLVTLPATLKAHLRASHLDRLRASGPFGDLLARQSELHGVETHMNDLGSSHPGLPDDLINFHYDPVTAAVALGWPGASLQAIRLVPVLEGTVLRFQPSESGPITHVVADVNGTDFAELWLQTIERI